MNKPVLALLLFFSVLLLFSCHKSKGCSTSAIIVHNGPSCSSWGINVGNNYISDNIPDQFKQEGLRVCVEYELYEDMRLCACCGGTRARIISISSPD